MGKIFWEFKEYIVIAILLGVIAAGGFGWKTHVDILSGQLDNEKAAHALTKEAFKTEAKKWDEQLKAQIEALNKSKKEKDSIIQKHRKSFDELYKKYSEVENALKVALANAFNPDDVVVVPRKFIGLYNDAAAKRSDTPDVDGGATEAPSYTGEPLAEIATFDATAFSEVVIGNVLEYHRLAQRCDALVDVVMELEASNERANPVGIEGSTLSDGGDGISRAVRDNIL